MTLVDQLANILTYLSLINQIFHSLAYSPTVLCHMFSFNCKRFNITLMLSISMTIDDFVSVFCTVDISYEQHAKSVNDEMSR